MNPPFRSAMPGGELAKTVVADSQILPFSSHDCSSFNNLINGPLSRLEHAAKDCLYGRAMARVLAHEFYHVLVKTHKHTARGIAKRSHSAEDLLSERFDFDRVALGLLRGVSNPGGALAAAAKHQTGSEGASSEASSEPVNDTAAEPIRR